MTDREKEILNQVRQRTIFSSEQSRTDFYFLIGVIGRMEEEIETYRSWLMVFHEFMKTNPVPRRKYDRIANPLLHTEEQV